MNTHEKSIKEAADEHALGILGEDQFATHGDAVKAITEDFITGAEWYMKSDNPQLLQALHDAIEELGLTEKVYEIINRDYPMDKI